MGLFAFLGLGNRFLSDQFLTDTDQLPEETTEAAPSRTAVGQDGTGVGFGLPSSAQSVALQETFAVTTISYDALFKEIERSVTSDPNFMLIADTFLGIYPAARITMTGQDRFMASAIWASIGHSVGAAPALLLPIERGLLWFVETAASR